MSDVWIIRERTDCRLCHTPVTGPHLILPMTPPANAYRADLTTPEAKYPLELCLCPNCGHVQLRHVVHPEILFRDYRYISPKGMEAHWKQHAEAMVLRFSLAPGDLVVEIGSNDGALLKEYQKRGMRVLGFEPAVEIAKSASVTTSPTFFTRQVVEVAEVENAKLVLANNVFAHIDDLDDVVEGVKSILAPDGVFVFEVQWLGALVRDGLWDMVYHEHLDYHALGPLLGFFLKHDLGVFDVDLVETHGGSIRVFVRRNNVPDDTPKQYCVHDVLEMEQQLLLSNPMTLLKLQKDIRLKCDRVTSLLNHARWSVLNAGGQEPRIAGYGCPAKATTLLHALGQETINSIAYIVDDSKWKQGLYVPGTSIPICSNTRLVTEPPDVLIIFAWNYAESIIEKVKALSAELHFPCPRFLVPLPEPRLL